MKTNKPSKGGNKKVCKSVEIRKDKKINMILIRDAILEYIHDNNKPPTLLELSKKLKIHSNTISKHIKEINFDTEESIYRTFTPDVVMSIINSSKKGSSASQKLYMQIFEKFSERLEHTGKDGEKLFPDKINIVVKK